MSVTTLVASLAAILALHQYYMIFGHTNGSEQQPRFNNLRAWPENKSRDVKIYIHPNKVTTIHEPKNVCTEHEYKQLFLLIIISSASGNFEVRKNIRRHWGRTRTQILGLILENEREMAGFKKKRQMLMNNSLAVDNQTAAAVTRDLKEFKVVFMLGLSPSNAQSTDNAIQKKIDKEAKVYGDIIQEDFMDTYYNLSIKSVMILKWLTRKCDEKVRYILKTDDDISINILPLLLSLADRSIRFDENHLNSSDKVEYALLGDQTCNLSPKREVDNKWYVPEYLYPDDIYPCFIFGRGYVYTMPTAFALYNAALETPLFPLEDVYITGIVREKAKPKIRLEHDYIISYSTDVNPVFSSM